jgi:hypothetical protein
LLSESVKQKYLRQIVSNDILHIGRCGGTGSMGEAYANRPCRGVSGKRPLFAACWGVLHTPCGGRLERRGGFPFFQFYHSYSLLQANTGLDRQVPPLTQLAVYSVHNIRRCRKCKRNKLHGRHRQPTLWASSLT